MYGSSTCDGATHVLATYGMSYVQYLQQQLRESYVHEHVVCSTERHRTCDMYSSSINSSSSSCDGDAHELST